MAQRDVGRRLTADDWVRAALAAVGEQGLAGVAVEPLAARLGTTKGSFYWHFRNRDALVEAVLKLWERRHTEMVIEVVAAENDPRQRLRALLFASLGDVTSAGIEVNLMASADQPVVAATLRRVVDRRLAFLRDIFRALGLGHGEAERRALFAYASYLGTAELDRRLPGVLPEATASRSSYVEGVIALFLSE